LCYQWCVPMSKIVLAKTTGLHPKADRIVEIGSVAGD
jgi:hypothetical protein